MQKEHFLDEDVPTGNQDDLYFDESQSNPNDPEVNFDDS